LVIWSFLAGNLKIVPFRKASGKIPAGLGLEQRFFFNESLINKLYENEAIFEQLFSEKKLFDFKANFNYLFYIYLFFHTLVKASLSHQQSFVKITEMGTIL